MHFLHQLREKPAHIRRYITLGITFVMYGIILFVWLSSQDARSHEKELQAKALSPLSGFVTVTKDIVTNIKNSVSGIPLYVENSNQSALATSTNPAAAPSATSSVPGFNLDSMIIIDETSSQSTSTLPL